jgi:hypothetical protein
MGYIYKATDNRRISQWKKDGEMTDYDVWLVHEYFSLYFCFHATDQDEAESLIAMTLSQEGLPQWLLTDAQEIKIEEMGVMA